MGRPMSYLLTAFFLLPCFPSLWFLTNPKMILQNTVWNHQCSIFQCSLYRCLGVLGYKKMLNIMCGLHKVKQNCKDSQNLYYVNVPRESPRWLCRIIKLRIALTFCEATWCFGTHLRNSCIRQLFFYLKKYIYLE